MIPFGRNQLLSRLLTRFLADHYEREITTKYRNHSFTPLPTSAYSYFGHLMFWSNEMKYLT